MTNSSYFIYGKLSQHKFMKVAPSMNYPEAPYQIKKGLNKLTASVFSWMKDLGKHEYKVIKREKSWHINYYIIEVY